MAIAIDFSHHHDVTDGLALGFWKRSPSELENTPLYGRSAQLYHRNEKNLRSILRKNSCFTGDEGDFLLVQDGRQWLILLGMGALQGHTINQIRRLGGGLWDSLESLASTQEGGIGPEKLVLRLDLTPLETAEFAFGLILKQWRIPESYRQKPDPDEPIILSHIILECDSPSAALAHFHHLKNLAEAVTFTRNLVIAPANDLTPESFEERLKPLDHYGIEVQSYAAKDHNLRLLQAVGQGSVISPRLVTLYWRGGVSDDKPIAIIGKGVTFDTGGISLKPSDSLEEMKGDMAGAAAAAGLILALAKNKIAINAVAVLAITENMASGSACRPGDVVEAFNGLTVEIIDTDAEGRLILADALAFAGKKFQPFLMIDMATLTGAVCVTLGTHRAGLFSNDDKFSDLLSQAGEAVEERVWRLPLVKEYDSALESDIADLKNCSWKRGPDALHAARFLENFVPESMPWIHLDIAGVSENEEGPTGYGVRLLYQMITHSLTNRVLKLPDFKLAH
jgi:leucyl aminopeptidase